MLHRDISLQNVLVEVFDRGAVLVKLSDFGLVKDTSSEFTRTKTEMRGTIRDPILHNFKDYNVLNEVYSIGWVLSYIFTGKESLKTGTDEVSRHVPHAHPLPECGAVGDAQGDGGDEDTGPGRGGDGWR